MSGLGEDLEPVDPRDDDCPPDYPTGPDPDDEEECFDPDDYRPPPEDDLDMPAVAVDSGEAPPSDISSPPFSNPDVPIEEIIEPDDDDGLSPRPDASEPIRVRRKQRTVSIDSADALPKAKAKVIIKKPKVHLRGHVQLISLPSMH